MVKFRLKEILEEKGRTKYWLSKQTCINNNALDRIYRNDTAQIKLETIYKITEALEVDIHEFMVKVKDDENEDQE